MLSYATENKEMPELSPLSLVALYVQEHGVLGSDQCG